MANRRELPLGAFESGPYRGLVTVGVPVFDRREVAPLGPFTYELLSPAAYMADITAQAQKAEKRLWVKAMTIEHSPHTDGLFQAMVERDNLGVDVRLAFDAYTDYRTNEEFHFFHPFTPRRVMRDMQQRRASYIDLLTDDDPDGRKHVVTNRPTGRMRRFPGNILYGRDHMKIDIVDDIAYLKGINLIPNMDRVDFALKTTNPAVVEGLATVFDRSFSEDAKPQYDDHVIACDENNAIIVDSGRRGESAIMDTVLQLVDAEPEGIVVLSQYRSKGKLLGGLNRAHMKRNVAVDYIAPPPLLNIKLKSVVSGLVAGNLFTSPHFDMHPQEKETHGKLMLFKGLGVAVVGSHCFEEFLVKTGTEEVALFTRQPEWVEALTNFTADMVTAA